MPCAHLEDWWNLLLLPGFIRPFPRVPLLVGVVGCVGLGVGGLGVGRLLGRWFGLRLSVSLAFFLSLLFFSPLFFRWPFGFIMIYCNHFVGSMVQG